jgi:hypothetical protein
MGRNKDIYNLAQAFKNYVIELDALIDKSSAQVRKKRSFNRKDLDELIEIKPFITDFLKQLKQMNLNKGQRDRIIKAFAKFRRRATIGVDRSVRDPFADINEVMKGIEQTGGEFFGTTVEIMATAYGLNSKQVNELNGAFQTLGTAMQFRDDFRDCSHDFGIVQNSTISIAKKYPLEFARIEKVKQQEIPRMWARKNLSETMKEVDRLFEYYLDKLPKTKQGQYLVQVCRDAHYMQ